MLELRDCHWSIPGIIHGQKTPAMMLLESPKFNKFGGGKGLRIDRIDPSWLALETDPGWKIPEISEDARRHLPDRRATQNMTRAEFIELLCGRYQESILDATEHFADRWGSVPPNLLTDLNLRWGTTTWPLDWCITYPSMFLCHSRIMGHRAISEGGFSVLDIPDGEYVATDGESGHPLGISVFLDPVRPGFIHFHGRLPILDNAKEAEVHLLLSEIVNAAAIAWRTQTRCALVLRHTEYICVTYEESSASRPNPTISISNVQHDDAAHPHTTPYPWAFTLLNVAVYNLCWWFEQGGARRWQPCQQDAFYLRHCKCGERAESPEPQSEELELVPVTIEEATRKLLPILSNS